MTMVTVVDCHLVFWSTAMDRIFDLLRLSFRARGTFLTLATSAMFASAPTWAHQPIGANIPVHPRIGTNVIPPLGNHLPSHRERLNRPTYIGGKIASLISPTSQEAMNWHRSAHQRLYANHAPWTESRYFYPKPWEVLTIGPRLPIDSTSTNMLEFAGEPVYGESPTPVDRDDDGPIKLAPTIETLPAPIP